MFPLRLDAVWKLLHAHLDDDRLREIHPRFLSGRTTREGSTVEFNGLSFPREKAAERIIKVGGRARRTAWNYVIEPPTRYAYEAKFENGSVMRLDNTYASAAGGTLVTTVGQFSIRRIPSFLATWIVKRSLTRTDQEDLAFARKMKF